MTKEASLNDIELVTYRSIVLLKYFHLTDGTHMIIQNTSGSHDIAASESHILFLIGEELKSRKFFNTLQELGLDDSWYQPHLDEAILTCLGLNDNTNETFDFYYSVMNTHAALIDKSTASVEEQARVVYVKLRLK